MFLSVQGWQRPSVVEKWIRELEPKCPAARVRKEVRRKAPPVPRHPTPVALFPSFGDTPCPASLSNPHLPSSLSLLHSPWWSVPSTPATLSTRHPPSRPVPLFFFLPGRKLHQHWSSCPSRLCDRGEGRWRTWSWGPCSQGCRPRLPARRGAV